MLSLKSSGFHVIMIVYRILSGCEKSQDAGAVHLQRCVSVQGNDKERARRHLGRKNVPELCTHCCSSRGEVALRTVSRTMMMRATGRSGNNPLIWQKVIT